MEISKEQQLCSPLFLSNLATHIGIINATIYGQLANLIMYSPNRLLIKECKDKLGNTCLNHIWIRCKITHLHKFISYMNVVTLKNHVRWLFRHHYIYIANLDRDYFNHTSWYALNMSKFRKINSLELKRDVLLCK